MGVDWRVTQKVQQEVRKLLVGCKAEQIRGLKDSVYRSHSLLKALDPSPLSYQHFPENLHILSAMPTHINVLMHAQRQEKAVLTV